ncbi:hypothetical protein SAMN05216210_1845 [Halopseudomonas salegens]|uniref:Uncharacterized protein n=1 Tax=Halopseudomonas salegens TaxID=1434072 RepID=A0A1H2FWX5_9GAMM|nr:hypothetical protein SAMN05216210_1845 [Halopseudomonas salegens]
MVGHFTESTDLHKSTVEKFVSLRAVSLFPVLRQIGIEQAWIITGQVQKYRLLTGQPAPWTALTRHPGRL